MTRTQDRTTRPGSRRAHRLPPGPRRPAGDLGRWRCIAYHLDLSWAAGGYLGVEVFFVVSGYLITLARPRRATPHRRHRTGSRSGAGGPAACSRPSSCWSSPCWPGPPSCSAAGELRRFRGDGVASLFYVQNWHPVVDRPALLRRRSAVRRRCATCGRWRSRSSSTCCGRCSSRGRCADSAGRATPATDPRRRAACSVLLMRVAGRHRRTRTGLLRHRHPGLRHPDRLRAGVRVATRPASSRDLAARAAAHHRRRRVVGAGHAAVAVRRTAASSTRGPIHGASCSSTSAPSCSSSWPPPIPARRSGGSSGRPALGRDRPAVVLALPVALAGHRVHPARASTGRSGGTGVRRPAGTHRRPVRDLVPVGRATVPRRPCAVMCSAGPCARPAPNPATRCCSPPPPCWPRASSSPSSPCPSPTSSVAVARPAVTIPLIPVTAAPLDHHDDGGPSPGTGRDRRTGSDHDPASPRPGEPPAPAARRATAAPAPPPPVTPDVTVVGESVTVGAVPDLQEVYGPRVQIDASRGTVVQRRRGRHRGAGPGGPAHTDGRDPHGQQRSGARRGAGPDQGRGRARPTARADQRPRATPLGGPGQRGPGRARQPPTSTPRWPTGTR